MANRFAVSLKAVKVKEANSKENIEDLVGSDVDYVVDEKAKTATLTKSGIAKAEAFFHLDNLMDPENMTIQHHINQAIKANGVMKRDVDYVVKDNEVLIVDEFTGRIMLGAATTRVCIRLRSKGERQRRAREQDPGDHHIPELFPPLQKALRYDRYGDDGIRRIQPDIRP